MKYSKHTSKFDPRHNPLAPARQHASVEVPLVPASLIARPTVAVVAFQPATQLHIEAAPPQAPKAQGQAAPMPADAGDDDSGEAMASEGAPVPAGHATREADAVSGDTTTVRAERLGEGSGEKPAPFSAMPIC